MINNKKVLGVITARGGSVRLPKKNILNFSGKPLIAYTIEQAKKSNYLDNIICSTDSKEIKDIALNYNCSVPFMRPKYLAKNSTNTLDVLIHLCKKIKSYDYIVLLQPTSPLRITKDIDEALEKCEKYNAFSVISVNKLDKKTNSMFHLDKNNNLNSFEKGFTKFNKKKLTKSIFLLNGAVYVLRYKNIIKKLPLISNKTIAHIMPNNRSIDIDDEIDFLLAEILYKKILT
ncbi:MAG: hypothetical protein CBB97_02110 [Candidatus Endolissoclinum sp. TMED37]|nr:MAG: hypothetical protein CBB97_02110 [Candidatus Endolissoclinum sp. TMED37]